MGSDGYFHPNFGPQKGKDLTFTISTTSGVQVRSQTEQLFQAEMKAIGIKINIQNYDASTLFGTVGPKGEFEIIEFAWVLDAVRLGEPVHLLLLHQRRELRPELEPLREPAGGQPVRPGSSRTSTPAKSASLYNQIDAILWKDMVTLPLFQKPQFCRLVEQVRQHRAEHQPRRRHLERQVGAEVLMSWPASTPARTGPEGGVVRSLAPAVSFDRSRIIQHGWIHH